MSTATRYIKSPGRARNLVSFRSLWFGEHELLQVTSLPGREDYDHLFYRDICALYILPTKNSRRLLIVCGLIVLGSLLAGISAISSDEMPSYIIFAAILGIPSLLVLLNELLRGPSCECYAVTAVQRYQLHAWNRVRRAKRCAAMLRERVIQAQAMED